MATFTPLDSYRSVQVTSGTQVQDVEVVTGVTGPTGITFTYAVPRIFWLDGTYITQLEDMAAYLEGLATDHHVTGGSPSQDFDPSNLLTDYVDLIITYNRDAQGLQPLNGMANVPIAAVVVYAAGAAAQGFGAGIPDPAGLCDDEYNRLAALAAI